MSMIRSLAKAKERQEKNERNSLQTSTAKECEDNQQQKLITSLPPQPVSGLGVLDYEAAVQNISKMSEKRGKYKLYSEDDRFKIGKYASENGNSKAIIHFKNKFAGLKESTVRTFKKQYQEELKESRIQRRSPNKILKAKRRGRPLLLGNIDAMVQKFLKSTRSRGGVVNSSVAIAVADALVKRYPEYELEHIQFRNRSWTRSLFKRMNFVRRVGTTGKVEIPEGARKEAELTFTYDIVSKVEKYEIPPSLILNLDQTNSKYVTVGKTTMTEKNTKSVPIAGSTDKRSMTATFTITLEGKFLPMQLIYAGKTSQSHPKVDFPDTFSLSANPKHYSNTAESIKLIKKIIIPYLEKERSSLNLLPTHQALLVMDVFRGQMTDDVLNLLKENSILLVRVPANMTHLYQPLDLTVNGHFKTFMRSKFSQWYSKQILLQLEGGADVQSVKVDVKLTIVKPLHAIWLIEYYNKMSSPEGQEVVQNGWLRSGITDAIKLGSSKLPSLDPFRDIDMVPAVQTFTEELSQVDLAIVCPSHSPDGTIIETHSDSDSSTWEGSEEDEYERNVFDLFD